MRADRANFLPSGACVLCLRGAAVGSGDPGRGSSNAQTRHTWTGLCAWRGMAALARELVGGIGANYAPQPTYAYAPPACYAPPPVVYYPPPVHSYYDVPPV